MKTYFCPDRRDYPLRLGRLQASRMRSTLSMFSSMFTSRPLNLPRLETFDSNSFVIHSVALGFTTRNKWRAVRGKLFNSPNAHEVPVFSSKVHSYTDSQRRRTLSVLSHWLLHCEQFILAPPWMHSIFLSKNFWMLVFFETRTLSDITFSRAECHVANEL